MDIKGTILRAKDGHPVPVLERVDQLEVSAIYAGLPGYNCCCG